MGQKRKGLLGAEQAKCHAQGLILETCPTVWGRPQHERRDSWDRAGTREACLQLFALFHSCCNSIILASGHLLHPAGFAVVTCMPGALNTSLP